MYPTIYVYIYIYINLYKDYSWAHAILQASIPFHCIQHFFCPFHTGLYIQHNDHGWIHAIPEVYICINLQFQPQIGHALM